MADNDGELKPGPQTGGAAPATGKDIISTLDRLRGRAGSYANMQRFIGEQGQIVQEKDTDLEAIDKTMKNLGMRIEETKAEAKDEKLKESRLLILKELEGQQRLEEDKRKKLKESRDTQWQYMDVATRDVNKTLAQFNALVGGERPVQSNPIVPQALDVPLVPPETPKSVPAEEPGLAKR